MRESKQAPAAHRHGAVGVAQRDLVVLLQLDVCAGLLLHLPDRAPALA
jgi:hypothetical protein